MTFWIASYALLLILHLGLHGRDAAMLLAALASDVVDSAADGRPSTAFGAACTCNGQRRGESGTEQRGLGRCLTTSMAIWASDAVRMAACRGDVEAVHRLLKDTRVDIGAAVQEAALIA